MNYKKFEPGVNDLSEKAYNLYSDSSFTISTATGSYYLHTNNYPSDRNLVGCAGYTLQELSDYIIAVLDYE